MTTSITAVTGIGPATALILKASGIKSAEDLARASVNDLLKIQGFSQSRAKAVIKSATNITSGTGSKSKAAASGKRASKDKKKKAKKDGKPKAGKKDKKKDKKKGKDKKGKDKKKRK